MNNLSLPCEIPDFGRHGEHCTRFDQFLFCFQWMCAPDWNNRALPTLFGTYKNNSSLEQVFLVINCYDGPLHRSTTILGLQAPRDVRQEQMFEFRTALIVSSSFTIGLRLLPHLNVRRQRLAGPEKSTFYTCEIAPLRLHERPPLCPSQLCYHAPGRRRVVKSSSSPSPDILV